MAITKVSVESTCWSDDEMETTCTETAVTLGKGAMMLNHLKNNRIEYLVLVLFSHVLGLTDLAINKASGVCG